MSGDKPKRAQKRRCVGLPKDTFDRLAAYCEANNIPKSRALEAILRPVLADVQLTPEDQHEDLLDQPAVP